MQNKRMEKVTSVIFFFMMVSFLLFTAPLTVAFLQRVLPNNATIPYFGLVLFDGGMFGWLLVYLYKSTGATQRGISMGMTLLSLVGAGILVGGEILQEAQEFVTFDQSILPPIVTTIIIVWVLLNLGAYLIYHLNDPEIRKQNELSLMQSAIFDQALGSVREKSKAISGELAEMISEVMVGKIVNEITDEYGEGKYEYEISKHKTGYKKQQRRRRAKKKKEREAKKEGDDIKW